MSKPESPDSPSLSASSSASPSQGASDLPQVRLADLVRWMEKVNRAIESLDKSVTSLGPYLDRQANAVSDLRADLGTFDRQAKFREDAQHNAIQKIPPALDQLTNRINRSLRLNADVISEERHLVEGVVKATEKATKDLSGTIATLPREPADEISASHIKLRWSTIAKYAPFVAKGAALVAAAGAAIWAAVKAFAHKF